MGKGGGWNGARAGRPVMCGLAIWAAGGCAGFVGPRRRVKQCVEIYAGGASRGDAVWRCALLSLNPSLT